ncbi:ATP-binding protein [Mesosutterella sp. AGMB02718]|uniref:ATP-binding protein n=1 Tax=Mesosutterella faecium TaxID=2925194 RepID=A0ABT7IPD3_9BURK|nr:ATP-binding protein [Mesosutterella sp. AGMB02718]MDL2060253.1 ATP-binding protein [Mesosutterella sp. AGMB02718]
MEYVSRLLSDAIRKSPKNKAVILFGARRAGKTTLLSHLLGNSDARWFSGDHSADVQMLTSLASAADLRVLLDGISSIVIDEAQKIPNIGLLIKRLADLGSSVRVFATASGSLDLADGVMESAAGRIRRFALWPLTIEEIALHTSWLDAVRSLPERLVFGSYPSIVLDPEEAKGSLTAYYDTLLFKDIFSCSGVRKHPAFLRLVEILAYRIGRMSTAESLARECDLSAGTVESYLGLLEESFIIKILPSYAANHANELKKSKKIYFCDLGVRNTAIADFSPFSTRPPEEQGALFENYFVMERIKRHSYKDRFVQHYFWRNKAGSEVDLIELNDDQMQAFEIKLNRSDVKTPSAFAAAYPGASFHVVNQSNFYRYFAEPETPKA